jgi:hypothetical protein
MMWCLHDGVDRVFILRGAYMVLESTGCTAAALHLCNLVHIQQQDVQRVGNL